MRRILLFLTFVATPTLLVAGPLDALREAAGKQDSLPRMPDDNIEGTIWDYKATYEAKLKEGEEKPKPLTGRFRTEGEAVFDVGRRLQLPDLPQGGPRALVEKLKEGPPSELKLPTSEVKRIGEYRLTKGKLVVKFNDPKTLHGTMTLRKKKRTNTVWHGDYREMEGKKTVRRWKVEVRKIED